ncbi:hypothetical protein [Noviherbaspirillum sp.]|uniref:hypothetical protein n=1 Tax=Noviherbaspirillum sp. TaxID=1926288 RepID=UPI002FE1BCBD
MKLGKGLRVVYDLAGSGTTLVLGYCAEQVSKICARSSLILRHNKTLAANLCSAMDAKGIKDWVQAAPYHSWYLRGLDVCHIQKPT